MDLEAQSPYVVPTRAVPAEIEIEGGRREEVIFYLANGAETHEGHETMDEALNRPRPFVPVRSRATEEVLLVRRRAMVTVRVGRDELPHLFQHLEGLTSFIDFVRLELQGGEVLEGAVATLLPAESPRMSDYFNQQEAGFVPLLMGEEVVYVNRDFIDVIHL